MILQQQFQHSEGDDSELEDNDVDRRSEGEEKSISGRSMDGVESSSNEVEDDNLEDGAFSNDEEDEKVATKEILLNGGSTSKTQNHEEVQEFEGPSGLLKVQEKGKSVDGDEDKDELSDYASGDEAMLSENNDQVAKANRTKSRENGQKMSVSTRLNDILEDVIASCRHDQDVENITPPDANWSTSEDEDCDDDNKKYNIEEFLKSSVNEKSVERSRKQRYSSNTSVDTSTTSGIGSFNEEHLDAEMGPLDSNKPSPCWSQLDSDLRAGKKSVHPMDIEEGEEEECLDEFDNDLPKISLSIHMKEDIDTLPLPSALKAYLRYYRD